MNKFPRRILILLFTFTFLCGNAQDEVDLWVEGPSNGPGNTLIFEVKTSNFTDMAYFQFSLNWDPGLVQFSHLQNLNEDLQLSENTNFNTEIAGQGQLAIVWFDYSGFGQSLPDSSVLFAAEFEALTEEIPETALYFSEEPIPITFGNTAGAVNVVLNPTSFATELGSMVNSFRIYPNPAKDYLFVEVEWPEPENFWIEILNGAGRVITQTKYQKAKRVNSQYSLAHLSPGFYLVRVKGLKGAISRRFIR